MKPSAPQPPDDSKNWKWGIFYYNPDDPRIFPPKRIPALGWTVNFANPRSIIAMSLLIGAIAIGSWLLKK